MKNITLILTLIFFSSCSAYRTVSFTEEEYFVKVYEVAGSKNELFTKANSWLISSFKNAESVIQHSDKEEGVIIGKYLMSGSVSYSRSAYSTTVDNRVFAIIDIRVKDNKARIEIKPQNSWEYNTDPLELGIESYSKDNAIDDMNRLANSLISTLNKESIDF